MDWGEFGFKSIYRASRILVGAAAAQAVDMPGLLKVLLDRSWNGPYVPAVALPGIAAVQVSLGFHSQHALLLFQAIRATLKYGPQKEQLENMQAQMDHLGEVIATAINATGSPPPGLPSASVSALVTPAANREYASILEKAIAHVRAYVALQDYVLSDIARCVREWNAFLAKNGEFLQERPRNIFERLGQVGVQRSRDFAQLNYISSFRSSVNSLTSHRNSWGRLLDLWPVSPVEALNF